MMTLAKKVRNVIIILLAVFVSAGTFIHYFQKKVPVELANHKKTFKPEIKEARINDLILLKNRLLENEISIDEFSKKFDESLILSDKREQEYYSKKKVIVTKNTYFNFPTLRRFTFMFTLILLGFISSLFGIYSNYNEDKELKPLLTKIGVLLCSISMFWIFWVFFNSMINENKVIYLLLFLSVSLISTVIINRGIKLLFSKKFKIKVLVDFVFRTRNKHYPEVASKALYAEIHDRSLKNDKTIEQSSNEFEDDLLETFEKIID